MIVYYCTNNRYYRRVSSGHYQYIPTEGDPDVYIKKDFKTNGSLYYKYMLVYVDDILHIAEDPTLDMSSLNQIYRLKDGSGPLNRYLGSNVNKVQLEDGSTAWSFTCVDYLKGAIENVDTMLKGSDTALKSVSDG